MEYGLIAALIAVGILLAMRNLAGATVGQLNRVDTEVQTATR